MNHLKKLISGLLMAALLLCCLAILPHPQAEAATVFSGTCGNNLTWVLDDAGTLTISGTGPMYNYSSAPWYSQRSSIQTVVIKKGVTSIGDCAFYDCTGLTSIVIPDSVTSIGDRAFCSCTGLTTITIPDSMTSISDRAFEDCTALTSILVEDGNAVYHSAGNCIIETNSKTLIAGCKTSQIPADGSVTSIGSYAFQNCTGLTSITIPDSVTSIGSFAFSGCTALTSILVEDGNAVYHSAGNCIIETNSKTLIAGCKASQIPADGSVTSIGSYAFQNCTGLTSITIPDSVTSIGGGAFYHCTALTTITIPDDVTTIGSSAFYDCTRLTSINIPEGVTTIGQSVFYLCTGLTNIIIPDSVTSIGSFAFSGCTALTTVTIGDGVTTIGWSAFSDCTALTTITIPDSVTSIDDYAFENCPVKKLIIAEGSETVTSNMVICESTLREVVIPDSVTSIGSSAFSSTGLTSITIPDSVTTIGSYAFSICTGLTSITIPDSVTTIGWSAFSDCTGLTTITIPDSVTTIGSWAFSGCPGVKDIFFDGSAPAMGSSMFYNVTATAYYYPDETWTEDVMQDYGGNITWKAIGSGQDVTISFEGLDVSGDPVTIQIFSEGVAEAAYEFNSADAAENADSWAVEGIAEGSYTVKVSKKNYVAREYPLTVGDEAAALDVELWLIGDVTGDGLVNFSDYSKVLSQSKNPNSQTLTDYAFLCGDVTGDGIINFSDYSKILSQAKGNHTLW